MPNSANARKTLRQNHDRRDANRAKKSALRTQIRKVRKAIAEGEMETAEAEFKLAVKKLDKAATKNLIHANAAARTKSRLSAAIKAAKSAS